MVANFYSSYPVDLATKSASLQPLEKTNSVAYSTCQNTTRGLQCVCDSGFTLHGGLCEPVCGGSRTFTPCTWVDRSASCTVVSSSVQCGCTRQSGFYGRYCFWHLAMAPCRPNWWGSSLCWPCRCDAAAGFLATCDQKSGNCLCANDFYNRSNTCTGCNCDPEGSISNGCSSEGNCSCYNQYIVGQRCDQCLDHLAEVTNKLCQVFRGYCPRHWRFGIQWQRSRFGEEVSQKCPLGFLGTATRICNFDAGWMEPNVDNCIADSFQVLIDRVKPLLLGEVQVSPQTLLDLIRSLSSILSARTKPEIKLDLADRLTLYPLEVAIIARSLQLLFNPLQMILTAQLIGGVSNFDSNLATVAQAAFVYSPAASWIRLHQLLERPEANKMLGVVPLCCRFWDLFHQLELFSSRLSGIIPTMFDIGLNVSIDKIVFFVYKHQPSNKTSSFLNISKSINFSKLQESKNIVISINSSLIQSKNSDSTTVSVIILEKVAISPNLSINTNGSSVVNSVVINLESSGVSMRNRSDGFVQLRFPLFNATNGSLITHRCVYLDSALNIINQTEYSWVSSSNLCESIVSPDRATVECRCYHMSTYTVVSTTMLSSPIIPIVLPVTLYVLLSIAFAISFVSLAVLTPLLHLRYLRLGLAFNFHLNISLFILTFLTGINKINSDKNWCLVAGMVLHFSAVSGSTLAVLLLLHTYRRLRIRANAADRDQTLLLYLLAAYAPILIIVFGTVVAATAVYTDSARCWMALPTVSAPTGATWAVMVPLALIVLMALALAVLLTVCFLRYGCAYNSQNVSKRNTSSTAGQSQPAPAAAPSKPTIMKKYFSRVNWNMGITANTADPPPQFKNNSVISPVLFYQQHRRFLADFHLVKLKQFLPLLGCGLLIPCGCLLLLCGAGLSQASVDLLNSGLDILTAASVIMLLGVVSAVLGTVIFDDIVACSWISLVANRGRFDEMLRCSYFDKKEFGDSVISGEIKIPDNTHINLGENGIFNMGFLQDLPSESSSSAESE